MASAAHPPPGPPADFSTVEPSGTADDAWCRLERDAREHSYALQRETADAELIAHRLTTLVVAARKATQIPVVLDKLHTYLHTRQLGPFALLHSQLGLLEAQLLDAPLDGPAHAGPGDPPSDDGPDSNFLHRITPRSAKVVVALVSTLRKHPDLLAAALADMPGHELDALTETRPGPLHGGLLHTLLFSLFGSPAHPREDTLRLELWTPVMVRLLSERKGEQFVLKVLERWAHHPEYQDPDAKGQFETQLLRILHRGAKFPRWVREYAATAHQHHHHHPSTLAGRGPPGSPTTSRPVDLEPFYDDACVDVLTVLPRFVPRPLVRLSRRVFAQLPAESHLYASLLIILRFLFYRFLQRAVTSPESLGLLEDYYVSDQQREMVLMGVYQRLYRHAQTVIVPPSARARAPAPLDPRIHSLLLNVVALFREGAEDALPAPVASQPTTEAVFPPGHAFAPVVGPLICLTAADLLQLHTFLQTWWIPLVMPATQPSVLQTKSKATGAAAATPPHAPGLPTPPASAPGRPGRGSLAREMKVYQSSLFGMLIGTMKKAVAEIHTLPPQSHALLFAQVDHRGVTLTDPALAAPSVEMVMDTTSDLDEFVRAQLPTWPGPWVKGQASETLDVATWSRLGHGVTLAHDAVLQGVHRYDTYLQASDAGQLLPRLQRMQRASRYARDYAAALALQRTLTFLTDHLPFADQLAPAYTPFATLLTAYYDQLRQAADRRQARRTVWAAYCADLETRLRTHLRFRQAQLLALSLRGFYAQVRLQPWFAAAQAALRKWSQSASLDATECRLVKEYLTHHGLTNFLTGEDRFHRAVIELQRVRDRALEAWPGWVRDGTLGTPVASAPSSAAAATYAGSAFSNAPERRTTAGPPGRDPTDHGLPGAAHPAPHLVPRIPSLPGKDLAQPRLGLYFSPQVAANAASLRRFSPGPLTANASHRPGHSSSVGDHLPPRHPSFPPPPGTTGLLPPLASPGALPEWYLLTAPPPPMSVPASPALYPGLAAYFNPPGGTTHPSHTPAAPAAATGNREGGSGGGYFSLPFGTTSSTTATTTATRSSAPTPPGPQQQWWSHGWPDRSAITPATYPNMTAPPVPVSGTHATPYYYGFAGPQRYALVRGDWTAHLGLKLMTLLLSETLILFRYSATDAWLREYLQQPKPSEDGDGDAPEDLSALSLDALITDLNRQTRSVGGFDPIAEESAPRTAIDHDDPLADNPLLQAAFDTFRQQFHLHPAPLQKLHCLVAFEAALVEHLTHRPPRAAATSGDPLDWAARPPGTDVIVSALEAVFRRHRPKCFLRDLQLLVMLLPPAVLDLTSAGKVFWDVTMAMSSLKREGVQALVKRAQRMLDLASRSRSAPYPTTTTAPVPTPSAGHLTSGEDEDTDSATVSLASAALASPPPPLRPGSLDSTASRHSIRTLSSTRPASLIRGSGDADSFDDLATCPRCYLGPTNSCPRCESTRSAERREAQYQSLALRLFSIAAREGDAEAQRELGILFLSLPAVRPARLSAAPGSSSEDTDDAPGADSDHEAASERSVNTTTATTVRSTLGQWLDKVGGPDHSPRLGAALDVSEITIQPFPPLQLTIPRTGIHHPLNASAPQSAPVLPSPPKRHSSRETGGLLQGMGGTGGGPPMLPTSPPMRNTTGPAHAGPGAAPPTVTPALVTTMSTPLVSAASQAHSRTPSLGEGEFEASSSIVSSGPSTSAVPAPHQPSIPLPTTVGAPTTVAARAIASRGRPAAKGSAGFMSTSFKNFLSPILGGTSFFGPGTSAKASGRVSRTPSTHDGQAAGDAMVAPSSPATTTAPVSGGSRTRSHSVSVTGAMEPRGGGFTQHAVSSAVDLSRSMAAGSTAASPEDSRPLALAALHRSVSTHGYDSTTTASAASGRGHHRVSRHQSSLLRDSFLASSTAAHLGASSTTASTVAHQHNPSSSNPTNCDSGDETKCNPENIAAALYWFGRAAAQGDTVADRYLRHRDGPLSLLSNLPGSSTTTATSTTTNSSSSAKSSALPAALRDDVQVASAASASAAAVAAGAGMDLGRSLDSAPRAPPDLSSPPGSAGRTGRSSFHHYHHHSHGHAPVSPPGLTAMRTSGSRTSLSGLLVASPLSPDGTLPSPLPPMARPPTSGRRTSLFTIPSAASSSSSLSSLTSGPMTTPSTVIASSTVGPHHHHHHHHHLPAGLRRSPSPAAVGSATSGNYPPSLSQFTFTVTPPLAARTSPALVTTRPRSQLGLHPVTSASELSTDVRRLSETATAIAVSSPPVATGRPGRRAHASLSSPGRARRRTSTSSIKSTVAPPAPSAAASTTPVTLPTSHPTVSDPLSSPSSIPLSPPSPSLPTVSFQLGDQPLAPLPCSTTPRLVRRDMLPADTSAADTTATRPTPARATPHSSRCREAVVSSSPTPAATTSSVARSTVSSATTVSSAAAKGVTPEPLTPRASSPPPMTTAVSSSSVRASYNQDNNRSLPCIHAQLRSQETLAQ